MTLETRTPAPCSLERTAFVALVVSLVAPIVAQGLWRPLVHVLGPEADAAVVTWAALAIAGTIVGVRALAPARAPALSLVAGALVASGATLGGSLGLAGLLTLLAVAVAAAWLRERLTPRLPATLDGLARRHPLSTLLYVALALLTVVATARLCVFMGDSTRADLQALPGEEFLETHSCLTAYVRADELSGQRVDNLYADRWWAGSHGFEPAPAGAVNPYAPFGLDYYAYPPPFLLLMAPLRPLYGDFAAQRALWFGLNGLVWAVALWVVARFIDGPRAHRALLLAPVFFGSLPVLVTLQVGNVHLAVVAISVLAMMAFHRDRPALGGALLAVAILSKLSPGLLGVILLAQRRWLAAAWSAGFGALLVALSLLTQGVGPTESFLTYTLSRLGSGEAFAFMDDDAFSLIINMAPFGLPFKLGLMGLDVGDPWVVGRWLGRGYSVLLIVLVLVAARRRGARRTQAMTWMSILVLASLQSPFAPGYTLIALLWAITLASVEVRGRRGAVALVVLWLVLTVVPPVGLPFLAALSIVQSALAIGVPLWIIVRAERTPVAGSSDEGASH